jgi:hydroxypyruvate isomerase
MQKSADAVRKLDRRHLLKKALGGTATLAALRGAAADSAVSVQGGGRIKQSVCQWCYGKITKTAEDREKFYEAVAALGIKGVDLTGPGDWPAMKKHGLVCSMVGSHGIGKGFNRKENHAECIAAVKKGIDQAAEHGWQNVICFSGNRAGLGDEEGAKACIEGLKQVIGYAEEKKITLCMELLNSKRNHKDYQCDHTAWGVAVCKGVGSPRMKLLYDIYHMQIMEGDVIATIKESIQYIGHIHTGGVPGRNEIDETQELDYPPIMRAIAELKFEGFVGQEFIPKRDALASLAQAVKICNV